jgi:hypothetical protein
MKKSILLVGCLCIGIMGFAQKMNIESAKNYLRDQEYDKAKKAIDDAVNNESTSKNADAWFTRGDVYMTLTDKQREKYKGEHLYREAARSYIKVVELKPNYPKEDINPRLYISAQLFYNDAINAYNSQKYDETIEMARFVVEIIDMDGGKRLHDMKGSDTVVAQAKLVRAYSAYYLKKYDEALPLLLEVKNNPIVKKAGTFAHIADIYKAKNKEAEFLATIEEGKKAFPDDQNLNYEELNYYIRNGKQDDLAKKLEDAVAKNPKNAELQYNLATCYNNIAFPKDANGKDMPKPTNYSDVVNKAEGAYIKAIELDSKNPLYNYNIAALYYNQAIEINDQMNALGNTTTEIKKYDEMKVQRDAKFEKSVPYLEITYNQLYPKLGKLGAEDKNTLKASMMALSNIYLRQSKMDKANEVKAKLKELDK